MTPAQTASQVESHAGFASDLAAHFAPGGIVISEPRFFIMARPVRRDAAQDALLNPWRRWQHPDAWMVWLAAGDLAAALETLWPMFGGGKVWLAFQTDGPARFVRINLILKLYGQRRWKQQRSPQAPEAEHEGQPEAGETA